MKYKVSQSKRKTISLEIQLDGSLQVRAPLWISKSDIDAFVISKSAWIQRHRTKIKERGLQEKVCYGNDEIQIMKDELHKYIVPRVETFWRRYNLPKYHSIKITKSEKRWGSCSSKNSLCFSYRLAAYMPKSHQASSLFIDAVIMHELAHLKEKNHQKTFWDLLYRMMPSYDMAIKSKNMSQK